MNNQIKTMDDLRREIASLKKKQDQQEEKLKSSVQNLAESLKPANLIKSTLRSFGSDSKLRGDLTKKGTEAVVGFLISNLLLRNFGPAAKTLASLAGTTVATTVLGEHAGTYIEKFKNLLEKFKKKTGGKDSAFDEKDIYS